MEKWDGSALRKKRAEDQLSAGALAKKWNTTKENIYKWEGTTRPHNPEMLKKIVDYIGISSNGQPVPDENWKEKYYSLLEKYTALLEKKP